MDQARYVMAVFALVCYPPAIFFWYLLHPLVRFWRRVGIGVTYTLIVLLMGLAVWALWSFQLATGWDRGPSDDRGTDGGGPVQEGPQALDADWGS